MPSTTNTMYSGCGSGELCLRLCPQPLSYHLPVPLRPQGPAQPRDHIPDSSRSTVLGPWASSRPFSAGQRLSWTPHSTIQGGRQRPPRLPCELRSVWLPQGTNDSNAPNRLENLQTHIGHRSVSANQAIEARYTQRFIHKRTPCQDTQRARARCPPALIQALHPAAHTATQHPSRRRCPWS